MEHLFRCIFAPGTFSPDAVLEPEVPAVTDMYPGWMTWRSWKWVKNYGFFHDLWEIYGKYTGK